MLFCKINVIISRNIIIILIIISKRKHYYYKIEFKKLNAATYENFYILQLISYNKQIYKKQNKYALLMKFNLKFNK